MPFDYYQRLSKRHRAIYEQSDAYGSVELDAPEAFHPAVHALGVNLMADDRVMVERCSAKIVRGLCDMLNIDWPSVRVLDQRPHSAAYELHGLYVREEDVRPVLMVWMRTAAQRRPVAHRTFLRTLLHEVVHHLDYDLLDFEESFHTLGFYQRESSLLRQLFPKRLECSVLSESKSRSKIRATPRATREKAIEHEALRQAKSLVNERVEQLKLPFLS